MRLASLLRPPGTGKRGQEPAYETPLSFSILDEYPDKPEMSSKFAAVGKRGSESVYSLLAFNLSAQDMGAIGRAKSSLIQKLLDYSGDIPDKMEHARRLTLEMLSGYGTNADKEMLAYLVVHDTLGYGPFSVLMDDSAHIEEIVVNSPESNIHVYHSLYGYCRTNMKFRSEKSFRYMLNKLVEDSEKEINAATPVIDAQLPGGARLHAQVRPYAINGASASIRLPGSKRFDVRELLKRNAADAGVFSYLWAAMESGANIIVTGAPSSGKTTMLSALLYFAPRYKRIITIEEDVNEIRLEQAEANHVALQGSTNEKSIHVKDQVINALHMRPDLLVVGEIRGEEAREIFFGANVGTQFITTMHSNLDKTALISRLSTKPMSVEPQSLCMLDMAVFMKAEMQGGRRIDKVVEYRWPARDETQASESNGMFEASETVSEGRTSQEALKGSKILSMFSKANLASRNDTLKELKRRAAFLNALTLPENSGVSTGMYIRKYGAVP